MAAHAAPGPARRLPALLIILAHCGARGLPLPPTRTNIDGEGVAVQRTGPMCGGIDPETHEFLQPQLGEERCGRLTSTNCSITYSPMACPDGCSYVAPSHVFACLFRCVKPQQCGLANPNRAYADPKTRVCRTCSVVGCKYCAQDRDTCEECHADFVLEAEGNQCTFYMDKVGKRYVSIVAKVLGCLIGALLPLSLLWFLIKGPHPNKEMHLFSVMRARRHRHLTKALQWELRNPRCVSSYFDLGVDVHKRNILGVGVALLYNSVVFVFLIGGLFYAVTRTVFEIAGAEALISFDDEPDELYKEGLQPQSGFPAVVVSRLSVCRGLDNMREAMKVFAHGNFWGMAVLYAAFFAALFFFARFQKRHNATFNSQNSTMCDFALRISGFPKDATDEPELRRWLQHEIRKVIPGSLKRPDEVIDRGKQGDVRVRRPDTQIEIEGVSVCYDYKDRWSEVEDMLQAMSMRQEVECAVEAEQAGFHHNIQHFITPEAVAEERADHHSKLRNFFEGDTRLRSNGDVFVVFKWAQDKDMVHKAWADGKFDGLRYLSTPLNIHWVNCEPPSVNWWHLGKSVSVAKLGKSVAYIALLIAIVVFGFVFPYYRCILQPYGSIGSAASGLKTAIMGVVIGNLNCLVSIQIWKTSSDVGFHRRETMDVMVLFGNVVLQLINNGFTIVVNYLQSFNAHRKHSLLEDFFSIYRMPSMGAENAFAESMYRMMVPGFFFVGNIMMLVMAGVWPFILNSFLMKVIYVWAALPKPLLKVLRGILPWSPDDLEKYPYWRAERALEPMEVHIGDYANLIVIPCMCCVLLFNMSPHTKDIFKQMMIWGAFYYAFLRYLHLRFCKKCFYTTNVVENHVQMLWGLPLSMVASAWVQWGFRSEAFCERERCPSDVAKLACLVAAFVASYTLWLTALYFGVDPWQAAKLEEVNAPTVSEANEQTVYSWFNCNPVFALKCEYYWHDAEGNTLTGRRMDSLGAEHPLACGEDTGKVRFFQIGKQYLFIKASKQHLAFPDESFPGDALEFETYLEIALNFWGRLTSGFARETSYGKLPEQPVAHERAAHEVLASQGEEALLHLRVER